MIPWEEFLAEVRTGNPAELPAGELAGVGRWKAELEQRALDSARELDPGFPYSDFERDLFFAAVHLGSTATVQMLEAGGALVEPDAS